MADQGEDRGPQWPRSQHGPIGHPAGTIRPLSNRLARNPEIESGWQFDDAQCLPTRVKARQRSHDQG